MKKQFLKKLTAFIIMMMFSISFLHAQCKGNKVLMSHIGGSRGCIEKCVAPSEVNKYLAEGWRYGRGGCNYECCPIGQINTKTQKRAQKKSDDTAQLSKKYLTQNTKK